MDWGIINEVSFCPSVLYTHGHMQQKKKACLSSLSGRAPTPLTLVVHPSFYHVNDGLGAPLGQAASTRIPLLVAAGQQVSPIKFTISGAGP
jgi:hypothetical protein